MDGCAFYDLVDAHSELEIAGIRDGTVLVKHEPTKALYSVDPELVASEEWEAVEAVLCGTRGAVVLSHMTRIVGYYSQVENWNKSKLGELDARRRGNYFIPEAAGAGAVAAAG